DQVDTGIPVQLAAIGRQTEVDIDLLRLLLAGQFTLKITDQTGKEHTQDFTWGVLAINTAKSVYVPGDQVKFEMAVLNKKGLMVCDANVQLTVTAPDGSQSLLTTEQGQIVANP